MEAQAAPADPDDARPATGEWSAFLASLPLVVVSVGLFAASGFVLRLDPSAGPAGFPLWGLLTTLGFIAAIGATVSWFYAAGPPPVAAATSDAAESGGAEDPTVSEGRPAPDVVRPALAAAPAEWDESELPAPAPRTPPRPIAVSVEPAPDDVVRALDEIAAIEDELENRPRREIPAAGAPARS
jgi:hypothetical protein